MAVRPLTAAQQRAVDELVAARRLDHVPVDEQRCAAFLQQAETALADLSNVRHAQNSYNLAYDAAHDVGEAMLAAYGYRTAHGPGQHDALGRVTSVYSSLRETSSRAVIEPFVDFGSLDLVGIVVPSGSTSDRSVIEADGSLR